MLPSARHLRVDESHAVAQRPEAGADAAPLVAVAFLAPSAVLSLFLPSLYRLAALALVGALALMLVLAARWSNRRAVEQGRDSAHWAFLTVVTLGTAMLLLLAPVPTGNAGKLFVCLECGHRSSAEDTFCYRCGAA